MAIVTLASHPPSFNSAENSLSTFIGSPSLNLMSFLMSFKPNTVIPSPGMGRGQLQKVTDLPQSRIEKWQLPPMKIKVLLPKECGIIVRNSKDGSYYFISVLIKTSIHKPNANI